MANELKEAWARLLRNKRKAAELKKHGFNLDDPEDENLPGAHRVYDVSSQNDEEHGVTLEKNLGNPDLQRPEPAEAHMDFAVAVAARVIDAFDCTSSKDVALHADCFRLAIGYPSCGSQSDVARRHGVNRANVSFHVRSIQRKVGLPFTLVANSRQKVRSK